MSRTPTADPRFIPDIEALRNGLPVCSTTGGSQGCRPKTSPHGIRALALLASIGGGFRPMSAIVG